MHLSPRFKKYQAIASEYMLLLGRILFGAVFLKDAAEHFTSEMIDAADAKGVYMPHIFVPFSGAIALVGGLLIIFGYKAKLGAGLIVKVLIPITVVMHDFWNFSSPRSVEFEFDLFAKNIGLLGAAFMMMYFGAGPLSVDSYLKKKKEGKLADKEKQRQREMGAKHASPALDHPAF